MINKLTLVTMVTDRPRFGETFSKDLFVQSICSAVVIKTTFLVDEYTFTQQIDSIAQLKGWHHGIHKWKNAQIQVHANPAVNMRRWAKNTSLKIVISKWFYRTILVRQNQHDLGRTKILRSLALYRSMLSKLHKECECWQSSSYWVKTNHILHIYTKVSCYWAPFSGSMVIHVKRLDCWRGPTCQ